MPTFATGLMIATIRIDPEPCGRTSAGVDEASVGERTDQLLNR